MRAENPKRLGIQELSVSIRLANDTQTSAKTSKKETLDALVEIVDRRLVYGNCSAGR